MPIAWTPVWPFPVAGALFRRARQLDVKHKERPPIGLLDISAHSILGFGCPGPESIQIQNLRRLLCLVDVPSAAFSGIKLLHFQSRSRRHVPPLYPRCPFSWGSTGFGEHHHDIHHDACQKEIYLFDLSPLWVFILFSLKRQEANLLHLCEVWGLSISKFDFCVGVPRMDGNMTTTMTTTTGDSGGQISFGYMAAPTSLVAVT